MRNILIVSEHFYPDNIIGARRPTKIAKKLCEQGYQVDVFARYGAEDVSGICNHLFSFDTLAMEVPSEVSLAAKKHGKFYSFVYHVLYPLRIVRNAHAVRKQFARLIADVEGVEYDAVFSSFGPLGSLFCGLYYKKKHPRTRWICDFRDPVIVKYIPKLWRPFFRSYEKKACRFADAIVAVSYGYLERICRGKYQDKAYMIPNGFDVDDAMFATDAVPMGDVMRLTYVGALYGGDRDLSPFFKALHELSNEGVIDPKKICVSYAGDEYSVMENQANAYGLKDTLENCGMLSHEDCLRLQFSSDMLLLSTWNDKDEYGVFPGKLLEYMLIGKPIVSITCGDLPGGEVTRVVREGNFGVAYEAARDEEDFAAFKAYLRQAYSEWETSGKVAFFPREEVLARYDYKTIMRNIEELIHG